MNLQNGLINIVIKLKSLKQILKVFSIKMLKLIKKRPLLFGVPLVSLWLIICCILYLIGGWTLVMAYLVCKLTGACII